ncbi:MAG: hypothetical protein ACPGEG_06410 [Salibacteraceae bacterium]
MNRVLGLGVVVLMVLGIVSCKEETSHTKYVENLSSVELNVTIMGGDLDGDQRLHVIPAGEKKSIYITVEEGSNDLNGNCLTDFDSLIVTYATDSLVNTITSKSSSDSDNWIYTEKEGNGKKVHTYCTFRIEEGHL